jgi:hypothetical protein
MITQKECLELFEYKNGNLYRKNGKKVGNLNSNGYLRVGIKYKLYDVHRVIFMLHYGFLPKNVDHIDGNPLNNKMENLRPANYQTNAQNRKCRKDNKIAIKGVSQNGKKWQVRVQIAKDKRKYFGSFDDLELAELVAIEARNKYHKEFANHG